jgi:hypothetical protein
MTKRVHVIKRDSGWAVKKQGAERASKIYGTKEAAVKGTEKLKQAGHDIVVHKKDGSIAEWHKSPKK